MAMTASLAACSSATDTAPTFRRSVTEHPITNDSIENVINQLYDRMTPEERLAQLQCRYMSDFFDEKGNLDTLKCRELIPNGIGHIPQYAGNSTESPDSLRDMVKALQEWIITNTPSGIPAMFHEEVLSGFCAYGSTIYPQQIGQACSFNTDLAAEKTRQTAKVMRKLGGTLSLSPMVDVVRNPFFNRLEESYGEDAYLSAAFGSAFVDGLQDGGLDKGVLTCSKHFLGYGGGGDAEEKELYEEILLPHETMIRTAGSKVVMMGYHQVNDTFCTVNHELMQGILRDYLGFDGMIVSDYGAMNEERIDRNPLNRAVAAINAGMDVEFPLIGNYSLLPEAIGKGLVSEATFERAVKRVLRMKAATGLLDDNPTLWGEGHIQYDTP
ncbi:MAG: beta-glucosidase, partial [Muribaculaceae bacterium]|nr:beta-glucosidase [Muribaculaceae bacterium]